MPLRRATVEAVSRTSTRDPDKFTMLDFISMYAYILDYIRGVFVRFSGSITSGFSDGGRAENELKNHAHAQSSFTEPERK